MFLHKNGLEKKAFKKLWRPLKPTSGEIFASKSRSVYEISHFSLFQSSTYDLSIWLTYLVSNIRDSGESIFSSRFQKRKRISDIRPCT